MKSQQSTCEDREVLKYNNKKTSIKLQLYPKLDGMTACICYRLIPTTGYSFSSFIC